MTTSHDPSYRHYLREWRKLRGLDQEELAKMVGSSGSVISRFELGERYMKADMLLRVTGALGITKEQLFSHPDELSLDALAAGATPEEKSQLGNLIRIFLSRGGRS